MARDALADGDGASVADLMPGDADADGGRGVPARGGGPAPGRRLGGVAAGRRARRERTVAIVLEDVHWADDLLLDVVEQLLGRSRRGSLLVVCTARPEFAERRPGWGAGANAVTVSLERLDDAQTAASAGHVPIRTWRRSKQPASSTAAEGNPLFAEHLAALVGDDDRTDRLPRSIQVLLSGAAGGAAGARARGRGRRRRRRQGVSGCRRRGR